MSRIVWKKYLTREYSFLYISYALECYSKSLKSYVLAHGQGRLVSLYGTDEDTKNCFSKINKIIHDDPEKIFLIINNFDNLVQENYDLANEIREANDKNEIRDLLFKIDQKYIETLGYYLLFVYMGYAGDYPDVKIFLDQHQAEFEKVRNSPIDKYMDNGLPGLFAKYDPKLVSLSAYMTRYELLDYLNGNSVDFEKIKNRQKEYLIVTKDNARAEYALRDVANALKAELGESIDYSTQKQITGKVACGGKANGLARKIFTSSDYSKIVDGDIIITPMTKPEITPYLSKVKGIVTNDGGALSHASIISREMNIPCIVGTIHATDVFADGQTVSLDADNGIVRKIY